MTVSRHLLWLLGSFGALVAVGLAWWQVFEGGHPTSDTAFFLASCIVSPFALIITLLAYVFDGAEPYNVAERVAFLFWVNLAFTLWGIFVLSRQIAAVICGLWLVYAAFAAILSVTS